MRISVTTKPRAKVEKVEQIDDTHFVVAVKAPPVKGHANEAVVRALGGYFKVAPSRITIIAGANSKKKIVEIA